MPHATAHKSVVYRLPALGVRLGASSRDEVWVAIGDYSGRDTPLCVCMVPVVRRGGRYHLYRRDGPGGDSPPEAKDIGRSVFVQYIGQPPTERASRGVPNVDAVVLRPAFEHVAVAKKFWSGTAPDKPHGVLALTMYLWVLPLNVPTTEFASDIASAIEEALKENRGHGLDRLIVPTTAIRPAKPQNKGFSFALASCQYTLGMVDGSPAGMSCGPGDASYERLREAVDQGLRFGILAGDQVYVDATAGLFDPTATRGRFRKPYEQYYGSSKVQDVQRMLPFYMVMDDHEVDNNWEDAKDHFWGDKMMMKLARAAYVEYERGISTLPDPVPADEMELWKALRLEGHDFFFADTRTSRETRTAEKLTECSLLGAKQSQELGDWLRVKDRPPRFLVSSSIVVPRRLATNQRPSAALHSDAWDGFPSSFEELLSIVAAEGRSNVVCLSGDEHLSCFATATLTCGKSSVTLWSIHCSGLYAPYPFSNSLPEDLSERELFRLRDRTTGKEWLCDVRAEFFTGQGFCVVSVEPKGKAGWTVRAEFNLDTGRTVREFQVSA